jgi:hypothetical protein
VAAGWCWRGVRDGGAVGVVLGLCCCRCCWWRWYR